jgi:hypothetical protein
LDCERVVGAGADAGQGVPEGVGDAPGVAAFADHDALDAEFQRGFAHAHGDLLHLVVVADEHAEVAGLRGLA